MNVCVRVKKFCTIGGGGEVVSLKVQSEGGLKNIWSNLDWFLIKQFEKLCRTSGTTYNESKLNEGVVLKYYLIQFNFILSIYKPLAR